MSCQRQGSEGPVHKPRDIKDCQHTPEAGNVGYKEGFFPRVFQGSKALKLTFYGVKVVHLFVYSK